ncbi:helix-turn-helix domain-containing protein [Lentzea aerocolonigenes]|uniref:helix-turn-helix domain-containing protein n=1 Tax=Lentzea aerocolonigenes TaxID=68170 RepID=UPI0007509EA0|nr:helix-turn-helix transcriptional regulator [Lentzea aerocolonigenes]MCP2247423.1 Helix-turn-helix domain-containing protein [Lentzea aerocolonigenes]
MPKRESNVVGREFGNGLRAAIAKTGLTQRKLAEELDWDESKISDAVNGKGGIDLHEVEVLLAYCRLPLGERKHLLALFLEAGEKGFILFPEDGVPDQVRTLINHEKESTEIVAWSMIVVPGLLQTPEYAYIVTEASPVEAEDVPKVAAARIARAEILRPGRTFTFYVHEQALWLPVGGEEVWREQLAHLLRMSVRQYINFHVIPRSVGAHAGIAGDFRVMKFPKYPPLVFLDTLNCGLFFDDKETVALYEDRVKRLAAVALNREESRAVIDNILEGLQ